MSDAPRAASLTVLAGPLVGKRVLLDKAIDETVVGSDPGCGLCLEGPGVSPIHAWFSKDAGVLRVYDTRSPRGVYLNDDRVEDSAAVRDGDIIWLGAPGEDQSVMLQCRWIESPAAVGPPGLARPAVAAPAPPPEEEMFFVDEPPVASPMPAVEGTDFFVASAPEAPITVDVDPLFVSPSDPAEEFFIEEAASEAVTEAPSAAPPAAILPAVPPAVIPPALIPPALPAASMRVAPSPAVEAPRTDRPRRNDSGVPRPAPRRSTPAPVPAGRAERRPAPLAKPRMPAAVSRRHLALAAAALLLVLAGGYSAIRLLGGPRVRAVSPARVGNGLTVTLSGGGFAPTAAEDKVRFADGKPGRVVRASATQMEVELPELEIPPSGDLQVPVVVEVRGRSSAPVGIVVYRTPRIHGVSPSVAMPGEEVLLAGVGWSSGATVRFGSVDAEVIETKGRSIRVRVPAISGPPGRSAPVVVSMSGESSNPAPFLVGRLPLVTSVEPRSASAGDVVTIEGRGFHFEAARNVVRVGGARALVISGGESELKAVVPWVAAAGEARVEVQVPGSDHLGDSSLAVTALPDPIEFRFAAEPFEEGRGRDHAVLATALGPVFVLSASGGRSAAERALEAQRRLNEAATALRASRDVDLETRGVGTQPEIALTGRAEPLMTLTVEDAAAYEEDWSKHGSKGGAVTRERLALWWTAVARDLVLLLVRSEKPHFAAALAAEGRPLAVLFMAARRSTPFGIAREIALRPPHKDVLRALALRIPASVAAPVTAAAGPAVAPTRSPPAPAAATALKLDGAWVGTEHAGSRTQYVTVTFRENGGTYALEGALSVTTPLSSVERPQKNTVRFSVQIRGGTRYYLGRWDGAKIVGKVTDDPGGRQEVGSFDLAPGR